MTTLYVQFSDSTQTAIIATFSSPQDPTVYPNQGTLDSEDPIYLEYINPGYSLAGQEEAIMLAIQGALDAEVQTRGYSDSNSACKYASDTPFLAPIGSTPEETELAALQEKFRIEGNAVKAWVSLTWAMAFIYMNGVEAGTNPMPTISQAVAMIPPFTWPD